MKSTWMKLRILPLTIAASLGFLGVKIHDLVESGQRLDRYLVSDAYAEEEKEQAEAKPEDAESEEAAKEVAETEKPDADTEEKEDGEKASDDEKKAEDEHGEKKPDAAEKPADPPVSLEDKKQFSQIELDLLQSLSKRREEIEAYAGELKMRENVLDATQLRIDEKLTKMTALKKELETLLAEYKKQEDSEIASLVKIYENMKPKDAARIFNELEMGILLQVVDKMAEKKAAPILANMSPIKAKDLTVELADMRKSRKEATQGLTENGAAL